MKVLKFVLKSYFDKYLKNTNFKVRHLRMAEQGEGTMKCRDEMWRIGSRGDLYYFYDF